MHHGNRIGAAFRISALNQAPSALKLCRLTAGLNLSEGLFIAPLTPFGADAGLAVQHAWNRRLSPYITRGCNRHSRAEQGYRQHDKRRWNTHWNNTLHPYRTHGSETRSIAARNFVRPVPA